MIRDQAAQIKLMCGKNSFFGHNATHWKFTRDGDDDCTILF